MFSGCGYVKIYDPNSLVPKFETANFKSYL